MGALFQGQFKGKPVQNDAYLLNLCLYIHANPVKDGLVDVPEAWEFSNYLEWMNLRPGTLVDHEFIHRNFGKAEDYQIQVMEYIKAKKAANEMEKYLTSEVL